MYCSGHNKAIVTYKLGSTAKQVYETDKTPIEVTAYQKRVAATNSFKNEGFGINFYSPNNRNWVTWIVHDYAFYPIENYAYPAISPWFCDRFDFNRNSSTKELSGPSIALDTLTILPDLKCPNPLTSRCYIEIKHKGLIIFQDQGDCPATFTVQCGDCPEDTIRCKCKEYPGYCCLPCKDVAGKINNIVVRA
ncbi:hypothetical protein IQ230_13800 [Gloeocapsopsis crepidinum LEGE 06123]|uniref:Uncharacterized protein n=1 Tax=Gloeocapsopsis crepidinum LEGE 06123 TaxID=588587 RepID=A0ABR9USY1_9CHRO|nr:hypothetical protein [Gloeocapsopsis crepidinum]MBE9191400.1 hypothetical protein [Gloeocapsopsis crepidinum LEGE 06123]